MLKIFNNELNPGNQDENMNFSTTCLLGIYKRDFNICLIYDIFLIFVINLKILLFIKYRIRLDKPNKIEREILYIFKIIFHQNFFDKQIR